MSPLYNQSRQSIDNWRGDTVDSLEYEIVLDVGNLDVLVVARISRHHFENERSHVRRTGHSSHVRHHISNPAMATISYCFLLVSLLESWSTSNFTLQLIIETQKLPVSSQRLIRSIFSNFHV